MDHLEGGTGRQSHLVAAGRKPVAIRVDPPARRIGLVHGLPNVASVVLFGSSLLARRRGGRTNGRRLAALGYAVSVVDGAAVHPQPCLEAPAEGSYAAASNGITA